MLWVGTHTSCCVCLFFFNDTATTEIYTLSLHDALPICSWISRFLTASNVAPTCHLPIHGDRKSTRLNSSHANISYAVFCLKKKTWRQCSLCWPSGQHRRFARLLTRHVTHCCLPSRLRRNLRRAAASHHGVEFFF